MAGVAEGDVVVAVLRFLQARGVTPCRVSLARGQGVNAPQTERTVLQEFPHVQLVDSGPDIVANSSDEWWQVECKGQGRGTPQTQRNNFDRALASVVSYYEDTPPNEIGTGAKRYLALALPSSDDYRWELKRRVRRALRERLDLWVLLYEPETRTIVPYAPKQEYDWTSRRRKPDWEDIPLV
jgi:hypothetical protein